MQERLKGYYNGILDKWRALEKTQKIKLIVTIALIVITLGAATYITTRPKMVTLVTNRDYSTISQMEVALSNVSIGYKRINNGTGLSVNEKDSDLALITLSTSKNITSATDFTYQDALDFSGMGTTEITKKENIRRAYQTDLNRRLELLDGVDKAAVTIVPPDDNVFLRDSGTKASATAILTLNRTMDRTQGEAIAKFLKSSIKGLELESVEILDSRGESIYSGSQRLVNSAAFGKEIELMRKIEVENSTRALVAPLFNEVKVSAQIKLKNDKVRVDSKTYTPTIADSAEGLIQRQQVDKQNVTGPNPDANPGVEANDQIDTYQANTEAQTSANTSSKTAEYLQNEELRSVEYATGDIDKEGSSVSVMVYNFREYDQKQMTESNLLNGQTWLEFKANQKEVLITGDNVTRIQESLKIATGINNLDFVAWEIPVFHDDVRRPIPIERLVMFGILALLILLLAYDLVRKAQPDEITEIEPELSVEDLLVSTQLEEEKIAEEARLRELQFGEESETKKLIEKFVTERPEAVAQLLRNWISEEWE